jgi:hypothetical protein
MLNPWLNEHKSTAAMNYFLSNKVRLYSQNITQWDQRKMLKLTIKGNNTKWRIVFQMKDKTN